MVRARLHKSACKHIGKAMATIVVAACSGVLPATAQTLPADARALDPTCVIPPATFASWFRAGTPASNGVVNPADSLNFPDAPNCSFYQWAAQMFLWLTSPAPGISPLFVSRIFDTTTFFDVSAPDTNGDRTLVPHTPGFTPTFGVRIAKRGPRGLPLIFSKTGQALEVERPQIIANAQLRMRDAKGNIVEVENAQRGEKDELIFRDKSGNPISRGPTPPPGPNGPASNVGTIPIQKFVLNKKVAVFIDAFGNVIDVGEVGQSEFGDAETNAPVLLAQTGSLVYYGIMVNDVYAYFLTGVKDNVIQPNLPLHSFPTTSSELNAITSLATARGVTFVDSHALAVEIKTSWVEASSLPNKNEYITIEATVPIYDETNSSTWPQLGTKTMQLALVGMHIVGSTSGKLKQDPLFPRPGFGITGHPEMIWATFEHFGNTPNSCYQYLNSNLSLSTVPSSTFNNCETSSGGTMVQPDTTGKWLFSASGASGQFNVPNVTQVDLGQPITGAPIMASNTLRENPWGSAFDRVPNPVASSAAQSNSEVIAINNSVQRLLPAPDIRRNYFLVGATWTLDGKGPTSNQPTQQNPNPPTNQVGTSQLANSTMETYHQSVQKFTTFGIKTDGGTNCFTCHISTPNFAATTDVSHIFGSIKPLF
jgi:hypothetical protein